MPLQTTRAYQLKKIIIKERNAVLYQNKQPFIQGTKETQKKKKKEAKTLKPKTSSPIKIHSRSDYRLFSVPSNTQVGLELQQKRRYRERRKDRAERKIYGHHRINTVRLYICHYQIVGTSSGTFFSIFLDLGKKYYFLLSFFVE